MRFTFILYGILFFTFFLSSCSPKLTAPTNNNNIVIFPSPPAKAKIQFLTSISNSTDVTKKRSRFTTYILGKEQALNINKPYGITVKNGKMYICDTMLGGLEIINLGKNTFQYFKPDGFGQFKKPINCDVDSDNNLFVVDIERKQVLVFDYLDNFALSFGENHLAKPTDIKIYGDKIFVSDIKNHKIFVYSKQNFQLLTSFPKVDEESPAFLNSPTNLFVIDDKVYVSDLGAFSVKIFNINGEYISSVGGYGKDLGRFVRPKGIAVDKELNLHVVDAGFENVQIFNKDNKLLMYYGGNYKSKGDMWLPAKVTIDYDNLRFFKKSVHKHFNLKYLIFVTNQFGPDKINVYGFVE